MIPVRFSAVVLQEVTNGRERDCRAWRILRSVVKDLRSETCKFSFFVVKENHGCRCVLL